MLTWVEDKPKQPEDGSYRVIAWRQRSACLRFSVEKSRNARSGKTTFTAWHHTPDPDAPVHWLGTYDGAEEARARCERYADLYLVRPPLPVPVRFNDLGDPS